MTAKERAACERMWIAGRATALRLQGVEPVAASMQATLESQQHAAFSGRNLMAQTMRWKRHE